MAAITQGHRATEQKVAIRDGHGDGWKPPHHCVLWTHEKEMAVEARTRDRFEDRQAFNRNLERLAVQRAEFVYLYEYVTVCVLDTARHSSEMKA